MAANLAPAPHARSMGVDFLRAICILYIVGY